MCGRADDVVDGVDVAALLLATLLLLFGAEFVAPLLDTGRDPVEGAIDEDAFGVVDDVAVAKLVVSSFEGTDADGVSVLLTLVDDADVGALFASAFGCAVSFLTFAFLLLISPVDKASVVPVDEAAARDGARGDGPLASSSAPK